MKFIDRLVVILLLATLFTGYIQAQDTLVVTANGFSSYSIDGETNPTLTLIRGNTYVFQVSASGHPFWINTTAGTGTSNAYSDGVTGNGTAIGDITFVVPQSAPDQLFYNCQFHSAMTGMINITSTVNTLDETFLPEKTVLGQNYPNPFNPTTQIFFTVGKTELVNLSVFSLTGNHVATLVNSTVPSGSHSISWNGMTDTGKPASAGIYFYRLITRSGSQTRQMLLLK